MPLLEPRSLGRSLTRRGRASNGADASAPRGPSLAIRHLGQRGVLGADVRCRCDEPCLGGADPPSRRFADDRRHALEPHLAAEISTRQQTLGRGRWPEHRVGTPGTTCPPYWISRPHRRMRLATYHALKRTASAERERGRRVARDGNGCPGVWLRRRVTPRIPAVARNEDPCPPPPQGHNPANTVDGPPACDPTVLGPRGGPSGLRQASILADWAEIDGRRFAWLSLGKADNDRMVLWAYIAAALTAAEGMTWTRDELSAIARVPDPVGVVIAHIEDRSGDGPRP